jgi:2-polyprenyl-6-methoxyphenol hydroxylase-like FAD-dependent oxidoreductase
METYDVLVRGSGIVGKSLALSLARQGLRIALLMDATDHNSRDLRAFAMNAASVALLARSIFQPGRSACPNWPGSLTRPC